MEEEEVLQDQVTIKIEDDGELLPPNPSKKRRTTRTSNVDPDPVFQAALLALIKRAI